MKTLLTYLTLLMVTFTISNGFSNSKTSETFAKIHSVKSRLDTATFAGGCFWAMEASFEQIKGVDHVISGYSGGKASDADYETVETGRTGHAETVEVVYDPSVISYDRLLDIFFIAHDPTQLNRQGPDVGSQYRSAIFYENSAQKAAADKKIKELNKSEFKDKIVTQVVPLRGFYPAENYHQNYVKAHPDQIYIRNVSMPKIHKVQKEFPELLKSSV